MCYGRAVDAVIAILPPEVIDQIAAGEVIERPASVVKELVDNAIDAGARMIAIETIAGGRELVRVADDGHGMTPENAVRAFERHATSKLAAVDDLWDLRTMGFRGEALPSIASVSRLALITRRPADLAGTRVVFEAGRLVEIAEAGAPAGTTVEVADLLFNLPARLKFLKTEATEATHITELVGRLAIAHPHIHFKLVHNGRAALELPPERDAFARAQAVLGAKITQRMVQASGEESAIRVTAYLAAPELAQTTARGVQLFAGPRAIRDRGLLHALAMGYGELIPRGRYPVAVVVVDAPPGSVDINVHPQKAEVRFAEPQAVYAAVRHVVAAGVASAAWRAETAGPIQLTAIASVAAPMLAGDHSATPLAQRYAAQLRASTQAQLGFDDRGSTPGGTAADERRGWIDASPRGLGRAREGDGARRARSRTTWARGSVAEGADRGGDAAASRAAEPQHGAFFSALRFLGQLDLTYLVCEAEGELVLVDQHAAHERVELARLENAAHRRWRCGRAEAAVPGHVRRLTVEQLALVARSTELLSRVGFEAEVFGQTTLALKALPAGIRHGLIQGELLKKLLAEWADDGAPSDDGRDRCAVLAEIACHSVVRAGDRLSASEATALLRSLDDVPPRHTRNPHGRRPVLMRPAARGPCARRFGR